MGVEGAVWPGASLIWGAWAWASRMATTPARQSAWWCSRWPAGTLEVAPLAPASFLGQEALGAGVGQGGLAGLGAELDQQVVEVLAVLGLEGDVDEAHVGPGGVGAHAGLAAAVDDLAEGAPGREQLLGLVVGLTQHRQGVGDDGRVGGLFEDLVEDGDGPR